MALGFAITLKNRGRSRLWRTPNRRFHRQGQPRARRQLHWSTGRPQSNIRKERGNRHSARAGGLTSRAVDVLNGACLPCLVAYFDAPELPPGFDLRTQAFLCLFDE